MRGLFGAVALTTLVLAGAVGVAAGWPAPTGPTMTARFALADLPNGVTDATVGEWQVYLWRSGTEVVAYSPRVEHGHAVTWCAEDHVFSEHLHHAAYAVTGAQVGPGGGELMRYRVLRDGDEVIVDVSALVPGHGTPSGYGSRWPAAPGPRAAEVAAEACAAV